MSDYWPEGNDEDDFGPLFDPKPNKPPEPELTHECKAAIVARLNEGPATCREIDRLTPARGQALIRTLRTEGHLILTRARDGKRSYIYKGFNPRTVKIRKFRDIYYQTPHWREVREQRLIIDRYTCVQCGDQNELEIHHWVYNLFAEDPQQELVTLCKSCHEFVHQSISGSICHFPDYGDEDTARKLGWEPKK
jgi:5-methylcytosine-specific restriction endonuclease McrA